MYKDFLCIFRLDKNICNHSECSRYEKLCLNPENCKYRDSGDTIGCLLCFIVPAIFYLVATYSNIFKIIGWVILGLITLFILFKNLKTFFILSIICILIYFIIINLKL